jgi:hypothetical protein
VGFDLPTLRSILAQTIPLNISSSGLAARGTSAFIRIQNMIAQTKKAFNPHSVSDFGLIPPALPC